jgi:hypothetical protein
VSFLPQTKNVFLSLSVPILDRVFKKEKKKTMNKQKNTKKSLKFNKKFDDDEC